eukprot:1137880-Pelagomonas_calceolata.AAC.1
MSAAAEQCLHGQQWAHVAAAAAPAPAPGAAAPAAESAAAAAAAGGAGWTGARWARWAFAQNNLRLIMNSQQTHSNFLIHGVLPTKMHICRQITTRLSYEKHWYSNLLPSSRYNDERCTTSNNSLTACQERQLGTPYVHGVALSGAPQLVQCWTD